MDRLDTTVPPVVAVMVVHLPSPTLGEALAGLAAQDYPDLRVLLLITGDREGPEITEVRHRARELVPDAVVRSLGGNPGWGPACNVALDLVEGDHGFFALLHDDVALEPDAIRLLVEETYRSNAGVVGPKLLEWDDPRRLHRVGFDVDRIGEIDPLVEPGERDQEQYDAVRDVFAVPSACVMIRADLFRMLRFDDRIDFHGEDLDLCWRAHLTGARVLVVPAARARHRGRLPERRTDLSHRALIARHRVWSVATLTGGRRLPGVLARLLIVTVAEFLVGLVTGRAKDSWSILAAVVGLVPRSGAVIARRRRLAGIRTVPDHEVAHLQIAGSARWRRFRRARELETTHTGRRPRGSRLADTVAWVVAVLVVVIGSRQVITSGSGHLAEMVALPSDPGRLVRDYLAPWWSAGGATMDPAPTGVGLVGVAGLLVFGRMELLHTLSIIGPIGLGLLGLWRLGGRLGDRTARRVTLLAGAFGPAAYGAITTGRWSVLVIWAVTPWLVELLVRPGGDEIGAGIAATRWRSIVAAGVLIAIVGAFVPLVAVIVLVMAVASAVGELFGASSLRQRFGAAATTLLRALAAVVLAAVMHLPWSLRLADSDRWEVITGGSTVTRRGVGLIELAQFGRATTALAVIGIAVLVPVVVAPLVARGVTAPWAARTGLIAVACGGVAVMADRSVLTVELGAAELWFAPVASMAAVAAGCLTASWRREILAGGFGWRQPVGVAAAACVVVGAFPVAVGVFDGRWDQTSGSLSVLLDQLPEDDDGHYRIVFIGDPAVVPVPSRPIADNVGIAVVDGSRLEATESRWLAATTPLTRLVSDAFEAIANRDSARLGRALAPGGIRYVVVPIVDGSVSTLDDPRVVPEGLLDAIGRQVDLRRISATSEVVIYENTVWIPVRAVLEGATARASTQAGLDALVAADLTDSMPVGRGRPLTASAADTVSVGPVASVHLGVPRSVGWRAFLDGDELAARPSFGSVTAWDLPAGADGVVELRPPSAQSRHVIVAVQTLVWLLAGAVALGVSSMRWGRRSRPGAPDTTGLPVVVLDSVPSGEIRV